MALDKKNRIKVKETIDSHKLSPLQEAFVSAFIGPAELDKTIAAKMASDEIGKKLLPSDALKVKKVQRAIHLRMNASTGWINEGTIIQKLYEEAVNGNTAASRVNALVWIGKHIGMWQDKVEKEAAPVYNIINYGDAKVDLPKVIEAEKITDEQKQVALPEGVSLTTYEV